MIDENLATKIEQILSKLDEIYQEVTKQKDLDTGISDKDDIKGFEEQDHPQKSEPKTCDIQKENEKLHSRVDGMKEVMRLKSLDMDKKDDEIERLKKDNARLDSNNRKLNDYIGGENIILYVKKCVWENPSSTTTSMETELYCQGFKVFDYENCQFRKNGLCCQDVPSQDSELMLKG